MATYSFRSILLLWDEYKSSTVAHFSTSVATVCWILSGISSNILFAVIAILLHVVPPVVYYDQYGPFGIEINYTPTKKSENGTIPDKVSERKNEAILNEGSGQLFASVSISKRLSGFSIRFSAPSELLDIPRDEHTYDRRNNVLIGTNIDQRSFSIVLAIIVEDPTTRRQEYPLEIIDDQSDRTIEKITLIDA